MGDDEHVTTTEPDADRQPPVAGPWTCPRCNSVRAAGDDFCGRCGARRPAPAPTAGEGSSEPTRDGFPVARALILNGVIVAAVVIAVVLGGNGGPGAIGFEPTTWRCDGTERSWTATIPARATDLRIEWRTGGPVGELRASTAIARQALERFAVADGSFRVTSSEPTAPECALTPGTWTLAIRDASDNALLASGNVELAAP